MIDYNDIIFNHIALHWAGNKSAEEGIIFSDSLISLEDENLTRVLLTYFLSSFSGNEMYRFYNDVGIEQNEMFTVARRIFNQPDDIFNQSKVIAQHLYNCSLHPKIKSGEIYVAYFENILLDNECTEAIGIFKSESKEEYIKADVENKNNLLSCDIGTTIDKLDKGCLIFNIDEEKGYKVCIIDNLNKSAEAAYWKDDFLCVQPLQNEFHQTNQFLGIAKQYVTKQITKEFDVTKADQIDLLNRSVAYFKTHESFEKDDFEKEVLGDSNVIESFRSFDKSYREENSVEVADSFEISKQAVKKQSRIFKSVLKLDKNFHIYIHGNRELIEQGIDEKGRKYYKIYYEEEN